MPWVCNGRLLLTATSFDNIPKSKYLIMSCERKAQVSVPCECQGQGFSKDKAAGNVPCSLSQCGSSKSHLSKHKRRHCTQVICTPPANSYLVPTPCKAGLLRVVPFPSSHRGISGPQQADFNRGFRSGCYNFNCTNPSQSICPLKPQQQSHSI